MTIQKKLHLIQESTGLTQTQLAQKLGVSFVAFNNWWTGKSLPRAKMQTAIDELYRESTGQRSVSDDVLTAKKKSLRSKAREYKNVLRTILENPDIRDQFLLKLTYNSNRIEGSTLSEPDTAAVLFHNVALPNKSLTEQLEAKNHQTALQYVFDHVARKQPIQEDLILKLHSMLMNGVHPDAGFYRRHAVRIVGVNLPTANFLKIPDLIPALIKEVNKKTTDVIALAAKIHGRFEQIHPFPDGNGRNGRLLMNALLLRSNLPPAVIQEKRKRLYYTTLYKSQTSDDQKPLEDFICDAVLDGFRILERRDLG